MPKATKETATKNAPSKGKVAKKAKDPNAPKRSIPIVPFRLFRPFDGSAVSPDARVETRLSYRLSL